MVLSACSNDNFVPNNQLESDNHFYFKDIDGEYLLTGLTTHGRTTKDIEIPAFFNGKKVVGLSNYAFFNCLNIESVVIPNSMVNISTRAFSGCKNLTSITLPTSLTKIESFAFSFCEKLTTITLPDSLKTIQNGAFEGCTEIEIINISEKSSLTTVDGANFDKTKWFASQPDGCVYLNKLLYKYKGVMPRNSIVNIKEGTVAIAAYAFYEQSGMTEIIFPESLTTINEIAFTRTGIRTINLTKNITDFSAACFLQNGLVRITLDDGNQSFCLKECAYQIFWK